jgi:hypothetical protein
VKDSSSSVKVAVAGTEISGGSLKAPTVIFIIGNRKAEFPHDRKDEHHVKSETLERFRRNNRNIDIITFEELFERAYHIVFSEKINLDWYENTNFKIQE